MSSKGKKRKSEKYKSCCINVKVFVFLILFVSNLWPLESGVVRLRGALSSDPDEKLYLSAARSFHGGHWSTSAIWMKELIDRYPNSSRRPKAALLLGQSYYKQKQYRQAYAVLSNNRLLAGNLADQYVYWMAESRLAHSSLDAADQIFGELLREFPDSSRRLESTISSAFIAAQREDWTRVILLLRPANGIFQTQLGGGAEGDLLQEGCLLLSGAFLEQKDQVSAKLLLDMLPRAMTVNRAQRKELLNIRVSMASGNFSETMGKLNQLQKGDTEWLIQIARLKVALLVKQKKWLTAAQVYVSLASEDIDPVASEGIYLKSAFLFIQGGDHVSAERALKSILNYPELNKSHPVVNCILGEMALLESDKVQDALKYFEAMKGNSVDQEIEARMLWGMGRCNHLLGDMSSASDFLYRAIDISKNNDLRAGILYSEGLLKVSEGDWVGAAEDFDRAISSKSIEHPLVLNDAARYMQIKVVLEATGLAEAEPILERLRSTTSPLLNNALLMMIQGAVRRGQMDDANKFLVEFRQREPGKNLLAAAELEHIRIQVSKERWTESVALYDKWLRDHRDNQLAAKVKLDRAWALNRSGQSQIAESAYKDIASSSDVSTEAFTAKIWLADKAFNTVTNRIYAERLYQEVAGATNSPPQLRQRAQMMSGRAAVARQGYDDARKSFSSLLDDRSTTESVRAKAVFALGDLTLIDIGASTEDSLARLTQSTNAFYSVIQIAPTNNLAARAWGKIGDGCLLISKAHPSFLLHAKKAYQNSLSVTAENDVYTSSQAHMGLAYTIERLAVGNGSEKELFNESLGHFLAVFYGQHLDASQKHNPYWRGQSRLAALRILEQLKSYEQALKICEELEHLFPGMKPGLRARKGRLEKLRLKQP